MAERIGLNLLRARLYAAFHYPVRKQGIAIVAIAKNESEYIREWVAFHKAVGFDHIILYDNDSTDNMRSKVEPFISEGYIAYETISGRARQMDAYNIALVKYGRRYRYMAFIDCDEFLFPVNQSTKLMEPLDNLVATNSHIGGFAVNWCMYGSSGHNEKPVVGGVIENYVYRAALPNGKGNAYIKTIVMPERVIKFNHPHYPIYKEGFFGVDFSGKIVPEWYNFIEDYVGFRINHYFTKSKAEWLKRRGQGTADGSATRTLDEFYEHDNNEVEDRSALFYLDRLKGVLKNR